MKKKAFLVPLAVSVAALLSIGSAQAVPTSEITRGNISAELPAPIASGLGQAFVIERADQGTVQMAGHASHVSHASHASHSSHSSHFSGR